MKKSLLNAEIFVSLKVYRKIVNKKYRKQKNPPPYAREMIAVVVTLLLTHLPTSLTRKTASVFNASLFKVSSLH